MAPDQSGRIRARSASRRRGSAADHDKLVSTLIPRRAGVGKHVTSRIVADGLIQTESSIADAITTAHLFRSAAILVHRAGIDVVVGP